MKSTKHTACGILVLLKLTIKDCEMHCGKNYLQVKFTNSYRKVTKKAFKTEENCRWHWIQGSISDFGDFISTKERNWSHCLFTEQRIAIFVSNLFTIMEDLEFCDFDVIRVENFSSYLSSKDNSKKMLFFSHPKSFLKNLRLPSSIVSSVY